MKSVIILPELLETILPKSSSHKLDLDIVHSLIGYETTRVESIIFHGDGFKLKIPESVAKTHKYSNFDKELDELLDKELPDFVAVFDISTLNKVRTKKISNLYLFLSEIPPNVNDSDKEFIENTDWVKVISFLPKDIINNRLKVDSYCEPYLHFMGDFDDIQTIKNEVTNVAVPIDFSAINFYGDPPIDEVMSLLDKYYPNCEVYFAFIGAQVADRSLPSRVHAVGCKNLGEYLQLVSTCDLQAIMNVPDCINLYPFMASELGVRTVFYSKTELIPELACPFMPKKLIEILGVNDVSVQADLVLIDDMKVYLRTLCARYDEIQFNLNLHLIIRSLNRDYRPQYRKSIEDRLNEMEEFYKNHPEYMKVKIKEPKDEGTENRESTSTDQ